MRFLNHAKFLSYQKKRSFLIRLDNVEICKTSQTFEEPFKSFKNLKVLQKLTLLWPYHANSKDVAFALL